MSSGRARGISLGLAGVFLVSILSGLFPVGLLSPMGVSGQDFSAYSDASLDGYISFSEASYPPLVFDSLDTSMNEIYVGQFIFHTPNYNVMRGYLSFDTSSIPDDAVIQQVLLKARLSSDLSWQDFSVQVFESDYVTLDASDWSLIGDYQGTLLNSASAVSDTVYSMNLKASSINVTGQSGYMLKSDRDNGSVPTTLEQLTFYSGDSSYPPSLEIWYATGGTSISYHLSTGAYVNSTMYAEIEQYNLTYDRWQFTYSTVPNTDNVTISIANISWEFLGVVPVCNYTLTSTELIMDDVYDSLVFSVWFAVPKVNAYSTIHISLYNAFTGEGFFWEQMKVQMCTGSTWDNTSVSLLSRSDVFVEPERNYTLRVLDYFNNPLVDYSFSANAQDVFVSIPVPVYSWQIFNMNDAPVLMSIYWNNSGSPWQFFVGPHWIIERFLKGGNYTFMVTFYNTDGTAGATVSFARTVPMTGLNASFIYVNGTTLSEIVSSVEGVMAVQTIITNLVSPNVILIYEDLPMAPAKLRTLSLSSSLALDPYLILEATTFQNSTGVAGVNSTLWSPHPSIVGATYYILSDTLTFSGTHATTLYVNRTDGTNLLTSAVLPATYVLNGENITVWGDVAYSVSRATVWREITEYTVNYYSTQKKYETTLAFNNSCSFDFYAPYWFIGFPNLTAIDPDSVTLYDLDNSVYLSQRTNFEVSSGGVHLTLVQLNSSAQRNFRLTYFDENSTTGIGAPNLVAESYTQSTLNGASMKYTAVQWTNPWSVEYRGEVYITLNFTNGEHLLPSSITIIDETTGNVIPNQFWIYTGRTILILTDGVGTVPVGGARNYGIYFTFDVVIDTEVKQDFFFGPIVFNGQQFWLGGFAVSWFLVVILIGWAIAGLRWWNDKKDANSLVIMVGALTIIGWYVGGFMV